MKKFTFRKSVGLTAAMYVMVVAGTLTLANSCSKSRKCDHNNMQPNTNTVTQNSGTANSSPASRQLSKAVSVAMIRKSADGSGTKVMFNELAEIFTVSDAALLSKLDAALAGNNMVQLTFDPWRGVVLQASPLSTQGITSAGRQAAAANTGMTFDMAHVNDPTKLNDPAGLGILNTTSTGLVDVIPDFATAQLMFDYLTHQCCALPGPYTIDHCISFQYCEDGCYARAHKMCFVINNKYNYATHKIFSFANSGSDQLSVKGEKWGGCCINWWYHVAPLVNVKTPTGTKAYVFDPAMFDQPVLLSVWLHAQENPACSSTAHVSMINIQPTSSYCPAGSTGYSFYTDPLYTDTDATLISYSPLTTCP